MMGWENVLDEQIALKNWWNTPHGQRYALAFANDVARKHPDLSEANKMANWSGFLARETHKLNIADPVWVAPPVCQIIAAALQAEPPFEPEPLLPADLPVPYGFLRFEEPFILPDGKDQPVGIVAMAWMPIVSEGYTERMGTDSGAPWEDQGIHVTLYSDRDDERDPGAVMLRDEGFPQRMIMLHQFPWWFGKGFDTDSWDLAAGHDPVQAPLNMLRWFALMQVAFRILQQKITSTGNTRLPRGFRRRAEREGFDPYTKVVTLRRYESKASDGFEGDGPFYSHRFLVEGHWRRQWYPSVEEHRQIWIHAFVKGPEDAELIVKPNRAVEVVR